MASECPIQMNPNLTSNMFADPKAMSTPERQLEEHQQHHKVFYAHQPEAHHFNPLGHRENLTPIPMERPFERGQCDASGNLLRGYNFLADQIYRSVSNPLYKLVRTVENTVGDSGSVKHVPLTAGDDRFTAHQQPQQPYHKFYNASKVFTNKHGEIKFEDSGNETGSNRFEETADRKMTVSPTPRNESPQSVPSSQVNPNFCLQEHSTALANTIVSSPSSTSSKSSFSFQGGDSHNLQQPAAPVTAAGITATRRQAGFNLWEPPGMSQQWYPSGVHQQSGGRATSEVLTYNGVNWPSAGNISIQKSLPNPFASISLGLQQSSRQPEPSKSPHSETPSPSESPVHSKLPNPVATGFIAHRYPGHYFQEWADANTIRECAYYPQPTPADPPHASTHCSSPQAAENASFPATSTAGSGTDNHSSCLGCCNPTTQHPTTAYSQPTYSGPELESETPNGLCLVDPMRSLPRYLTTGLWPPKIEWNNSESEARFYSGDVDAASGYASRVSAMQYMNTAAVAVASSSYGFAPQDNSNGIPTGHAAPGNNCFFSQMPRIGGQTGYSEMPPSLHQKMEAHRLSAVDCDPQELEAFAERFKQRRIKLGVTQADVGKALGRLNLAGVGSFSQSTICRFESLTLSHNNMLALKPILQAWLDEAEQEAAARQKNPGAFESGEEEERKRKRTSITDPEKRSLEAFFGIQPRPSSEKIAQIAEKLNLKKNVVRVWFCNQRQKQKRMKFSTVGLLHQMNGM